MVYCLWPAGLLGPTTASMTGHSTNSLLNALNSSISPLQTPSSGTPSPTLWSNSLASPASTPGKEMTDRVSSQTITLNMHSSSLEINQTLQSHRTWTWKWIHICFWSILHSNCFFRTYFIIISFYNGNNIYLFGPLVIGSQFALQSHCFLEPSPIVYYLIWFDFIVILNIGIVLYNSDIYLESQSTLQSHCCCLRTKSIILFEIYFFILSENSNHAGSFFSLGFSSPLMIHPATQATLTSILLSGVPGYTHNTPSPPPGLAPIDAQVNGVSDCSKAVSSLSSKVSTPSFTIMR